MLAPDTGNITEDHFSRSSASMQCVSCVN